MDDVKRAIESADAATLEKLLRENVLCANDLITWGEQGRIHTHPLHYISDMLIAGTLPRGKEIPLVEVLLSAGADANHQAANGETPLIGAASLGAEEVGLRLLEAGARPNTTGGFGATALHWAAHEGLARLVRGLIESGADIHVRDSQWDASPLGWAIHGWTTVRAPETRPYPEVVALLVKAGAEVKPEWLHDAKMRKNRDLLRALGSNRR